MEPWGYIKYIVNNYMEIRVGSAKSFLLVGPHHSVEYRNVAAITMEYVTYGEYWEVCTAQPRNIKRLEKKKLIWKYIK